MLKRIIYRLLERRHFWRYADFGEIAELYASRTLRVMAISMVSTFIAVYLYQNGYHLSFIMLYFACYFGLRAGLTFPAAFVVARIGPKHSTLISNLIYVPALIVFSQLGTYGMPVLVLAGLLQAMSVSLYDLSHLVNFSKVKHVEHVGKELSFMYMLERVGASVSPVAGGLIAFWFGPHITMLVAACIFALAALPLFFTPEPVRTHQQITFRHFNWKATWRGLLANVGVGADFITSGSVWSLYLAIAIFGTTSNAVYAQLGALISVTIIAALVFSRLYGVIIDRRRGGALLKAGVIGDALVHLSRPFVNTPIGAVFVNVANESATTAYSMPFAKGAFEQADSLPGYRIVYMTMIGVTAPLGAMLMSLVIAAISLLFDEVRSMQIAFLITSFAVLLIGLQRFPALRRYSPL